MSPADPVPRPNRDPTLLVILGLIGVLVLVALVVVFTRGQPAPLDAGTPGGVVQRYSAAVLAGNEDRAAGYLSDDALAECVDGAAPITEDIRVTLLDTVEHGATADVRVTIVTSSSDGLFGPEEYSREDAFELAVVDGEWMIDRAPWQLTVCPAGRGDRP
jgi:hypothetical protein